MALEIELVLCKIRKLFLIELVDSQQNTITFGDMYWEISLFKRDTFEL